MGNRTTKRLTAASLPTLSNTPGYHHDGGGLYLQVSAGGSKSWIFRYTRHKRTREMGIGSYSHVNLTAARAEVERLRALLAADKDPIHERDQARKAQMTSASKQRTFAECAKEYIALNAGGWKSAKHADQWTNTLEAYANPKLGDRLASEIDADLIVRALKPIWTTKHETASRVLQRIRMVMMWAKIQKYAPQLDPGIWDEVRSALPKISRRQITKHFEACPYREAPTLLRKVRDSTASDMTKLAFLFTVLTAVRSGEARGAIWSEISLADAVWTIPKERMKAGRDHRVPLSETVVAVLTYARKLAPESDIVFPNTKGTALSDMVFTQLLRRLGTDYTMHGFRSTFRDWAADQSHFAREVVEAALAHQITNQTEAAYLRSDFFQKRAALMDAWATYLSAPNQEDEKQ